MCETACLHVKLDFKVLAEPGRVVVAQRLGVAERLEQRIALCGKPGWLGAVE